MSTIASTTDTILLDRINARWLSGQPVANTASTFERVENRIHHAKQKTVCVSRGPTYTNLLVKSLARAVKPRQSFRLLTLYEPEYYSLATLNTCFDEVAFCTEKEHLKLEELAFVVSASNRRDLFIAGSADHEVKCITLWRGDLGPVLIPFSAFQPSGDGTRPDFSELSIIDYGQTVKLGDYEAATDAILYEHDSDYRARRNKQRRREDRRFGAAFRRLRKQRGLSRSDFEGLAEKTVARIERNETPQDEIRERTQVIVSRTLNVSFDEIATY